MGWGFFFIMMLIFMIVGIKMFLEAVVPIVLILLVIGVILLIVKGAANSKDVPNNATRNSDKNINDDYWCK